jgi:hypothetical protein
MNSYTTDEINKLLDCMSFEKGLAVIIYAGKTHFINLEKFICLVFVDLNLDPFKLQNMWELKDTEKDMLINMRKLIYEEPLPRVPLYINTLPIIVSWRLEMGK